MKQLVVLACLATAACESVIGGDFDAPATQRLSPGASAAGGGASAAAGAGGDFGSPEAGAGGTRQHGGEAGQGSQAGTGAGEAASAAGAGEVLTPLDNPDWSLPPVAPGCQSQVGFAPIELSHAASIASYTSADNTTELLAFAVDASAQSLAVRWIYRADGWTGWGCFDSVPEPNRIAAMLVDGGLQEVFVTTQHGSLFDRVMLPDARWTLWTTSARPTLSARARDVATWRGGAEPARVLLATSEGLYVKQFIELDGMERNVYGPWQRVDSAVYDRVTLCGTNTPYGFGLRGGRLYRFELQHLGVEPLADVTIPGLGDLDCVEGRDAELALYLVNGSITRVTLERNGGVREATPIVAPDIITSLSALVRPAGPDYLFATDGTGRGLLSPDGGASWSTDVW